MIPVYTAMQAKSVWRQLIVPVDVPNVIRALLKVTNLIFLRTYLAKIHSANQTMTFSLCDSV